MYPSPLSDTVVALVFLLPSQNLLALQVPPRHLEFTSSQSRGIVVYIVQHRRRLFPALILSADGEHSAIFMPFYNNGKYYNFWVFDFLCLILGGQGWRFCLFVFNFSHWE